MKRIIVLLLAAILIILPGIRALSEGPGGSSSGEEAISSGGPGSDDDSSGPSSPADEAVSGDQPGGPGGPGSSDDDSYGPGGSDVDSYGPGGPGGSDDSSYGPGSAGSSDDSSYGPGGPGVSDYSSYGPGGSGVSDDSSYGPGGSGVSDYSSYGPGGPGGSDDSSYGPGGPGGSDDSSDSSDHTVTALEAVLAGPDLGPGEFPDDGAGSSDSALLGPSGPSSSGGLAKGPGAPKRGYRVPEALMTVTPDISGEGLPESLPPAVSVVSFSVIDGQVHAELDQDVPKLRILELSEGTGEESTIFSQKNASSAEAHTMTRDSAAFKIRMIWKLGNADYVREYSARSGDAEFFRCTATETLDAADYFPYTSAVRTVYFNEDGIPVSVVLDLENDKEAFTRITGYDVDGSLTFVRQSWRTLEKYGYVMEVVQDGKGMLTALALRDNKFDIYIRSCPAGEDLLAEKSIRAVSRDTDLFDEALASKYPSLAAGISASGSRPRRSFLGAATPTDLPAATDPPAAEALDANTRIWALNFDRYPDTAVYVFVTADPVLDMRGKYAVINTDARDIAGNPVRIGKELKTGIPAFDLIMIKQPESEQ